MVWVQEEGSLCARPQVAVVDGDSECDDGRRRSLTVPRGENGCGGPTWTKFAQVAVAEENP